MYLEITKFSNSCLDLLASVDQTQETVVALQQEVAIMRATNTMLLQRLMDLETVVNDTKENVQDNEVDI